MTKQAQDPKQMQDHISETLRIAELIANASPNDSWNGLFGEISVGTRIWMEYGAQYGGEWTVVIDVDQDQRTVEVKNADGDTDRIFGLADSEYQVGAHL